METYKPKWPLVTRSGLLWNGLREAIYAHEEPSRALGRLLQVMSQQRFPSKSKGKRCTIMLHLLHA